MTTRLLKTCGIDVNAISVAYCTDEERYNTPDSHYVQIPEQLFRNFMQRDEPDKPLFIGICNSSLPKLCLYFGRVEPTLRTENSSADMCLLPEWVINKLQLDPMGDKVDIEIMREDFHIKKLGYIKLRGNISSYSKWENIKELLEIKLGNCNCVNVGDDFYINNVIFTIVELKDHDNNIIECGSTFQTETNLDFELPDDLRELERIRREEQFKHEQEMLKQATKQTSRKPDVVKHSGVTFGSRVATLTEDVKEEKEHEYFTGTGNKLSSDTVSRMPTREERVAMIMKKMKEEKENH